MAFEFSGDRFASAIAERGLDDAKLARLEGCSESLISLYRLGYRQPPPSRLVSLAFHLGRRVEDLFVEVDDERCVAVYPPMKADA